jgi:hypothetical protein
VNRPAFPLKIFDEKALRAKTDFLNAFNVIWPVQSPSSKIFGFAATPNQIYIRRRPAPLRGAFRERHGRGAGCGGRDGALDGRCQRGRRRRVVLTPRCWRQVGGFPLATVARKPITGESTL